MQEDPSSTKMIVVTEIEESVYKTFEAAAFQKYKQAVLSYGSRVWSEARSVAHQRNPDANLIEITTPDVEAAKVRTEMKMVKLRQVRFPFRLVVQLVTIALGLLIKVTYDTGNPAPGTPGKGYFFGEFCATVIVLALIIVFNYLDARAEALR